MESTKSPIRSRPTLACVIFCFLLVSAGFAQTVERKVDAFVRAEMKRQKIPGISLAVVKNGRPMIVKGYGFANLEHGVRVKPETIFQSGSVGKQFTATAIMLLVNEGKIGLDDHIGKFLGDVPESWAGITIRRLLSHTSGMTDYPENFDFRRDYSEDDLLKVIEQTPLAFSPGDKWQYSNLGYVTLGIIIHRVTGKFYGDVLKERIFGPLGMTTARIISEADIVPNRSAGYLLAKDGQIKNQGWVAPSLNTTADGALYLTTLDMIKWDAALRNGKILKKSSLDEMWTPIKLNSGKTYPYGFGWAIGSVNGHRLIEHSGSWQGFKAQIARYVDNDISVIVFANLAEAKQTEIAHGIAAIVDPRLEVRTKSADSK